MTCSNCGHPAERIDDGRIVQGHWPGCAVLQDVSEEIEESGDEVADGEGDAPEPCAYPGCANPRYSTHPRAKYCQDHKDPKNRKE